MPRRLHLSLGLATGSVPDPDPGTGARTGDRLAAHVRLAEEGRLDFVAVGDTAYGRGVRGRSVAVAALAGAARLTRRIGLVPEVPAAAGRTGHARTVDTVAALDTVSGGRAGWLAEPGARSGARTGPGAGLPYVPGSAQGRPPVAVALDVHDADPRWVFAAARAEVVLLDADGPGAAWLARAALLRRAADAGREPGGLRVLVRVAVRLDDGGHAQAPEPEPASAHGDLAPPPADTLRFTGTGTELAALLADWHAASGVDGFHLLPAAPGTDVPAVVREVVPALRGSGLFRAAYAGRTLRDHLELPRPAAPRTAPAPLAAPWPPAAVSRRLAAPRGPGRRRCR
ncbi:LLM class flavin-dependent oxidoreductase [Streptomyces sp. Z26]|uniref:LLM class flavin-dependent oxidoreductase n=1 Tax=Streptomyces sp. Z26 TaxID=2500177 RepID=UPI000EF14C72|nr:LLM class flavin-dependent oxidoreductase [Streptomyces sp. Z26]RLL65676.1 LLM class flavin-dependent oxidoreductase [Streptomyces sp. Z26]